MNRKQVLLLIAIVLVAARTVLVPFWEWKSEELDRLQAKRTQLAKAQALVDGEDQYEQALAHYQAVSDALLPRLFSNRDSTKLDVQKRVEVLLKEFDIDMQTIAWRDQSDDQTLELVVGLSAPLSRVVAWQLAIARDSKWIDAPEWRLRRAGRLTGDDARYIGEVVLRVSLSPELAAAAEGVN